MERHLNFALKKASTLDGVKDILLNLLIEIKANDPSNEVYFISGVITAEGPESRTKNREALRRYGQYVRDKYYPFAFSAVDVFSEELIKRVKTAGAQGKDFSPMWIKFINEGKEKLTGIITTPRWQNSPGSQMEVETATKLGLKVIRMEEELSPLQ